METASLRIKFTPLFKDCQKNHSKCYLEIVPEVTCVQNLELIEWKQKSDYIEYTIPMTYRVILRKRKSVKETSHDLEKMYHSCVDLLTPSSLTCINMGSGDMTTMVSDTIINGNLSTNLESGKSFIQNTELKSITKSNEDIQNKENHIDDSSSFKLNLLNSSTIIENQVDNNKNIRIDASTSQFQITNKKSIANNSDRVSNYSSRLQLHKQYNSVSDETPPIISADINKDDSLRKLSLTPICSISTNENPIYKSLQILSWDPVVCRMFEPQKIISGTVKIKDFFHESGTENLSNANLKVCENESMEDLFLKERKRELPEARVEKFMKKMETELNPLKIMLQDILQKCSTLGLSISEKYSINTVTFKKVPTVNQQIVKYSKTSEQQARCNRVVYSVMDHEAVVDQIVQSLSFEVVAVPQDIIQLDSTSKSAPLNVKIRVRKKDDAGLRHGVLSMPKVDRKDKVPERIRLVSSDQTIMSFNVVMEADFDKVPPKRNQNLKMVSPDVNGVDNYPSLSKKADNYKTSPVFTKRNRDIFGRCKPGGCLDPPFGEDKYSYQPTQLNLSLPAKDETTKLRSSSIFKNKLFKKKKKSSQDEICKTDTKNTTEADSILSLYEAGSLQTPIAHSNSIITYPHPSNSSELRIQEEKPPSRKRYSSENKSKSSVSEDNGSYYIIPKKTKKNVNQSDIIKTPQSDLKREDSDFNIAKLTNEINPEYRNTFEKTKELDDDTNVDSCKLSQSEDTPNYTPQVPILNPTPLNTTINDDENNTAEPEHEHKNMSLPMTKLDSDFKVNSYKSSQSIDHLNNTPKVSYLIPVPLNAIINDDKNDFTEAESQLKTSLQSIIKPDCDLKVNLNKSTQSIDEQSCNSQVPYLTPVPLNAIIREDKRREDSINGQEQNTFEEAFNIKPVIEDNLPSNNYDTHAITEVQVDSCTQKDNIGSIMDDQTDIKDSNKTEKQKKDSVILENNQTLKELLTTNELIVDSTISFNQKRFSDLQMNSASQNSQNNILSKDENDLSIDIHDIQQEYVTEPTLLHKIQNSETDNSQARLSATKQKIISITKSNMDLIEDDSNYFDVYSRNQTDIKSYPLVSTREKSMLNVTDFSQSVKQSSTQSISTITKFSKNTKNFSTEDLKHIWINDTDPLKSMADVITKTILPSKKSYENSLDASEGEQFLALNTFPGVEPVASNESKSKMESSTQSIQKSGDYYLDPLEDKKEEEKIKLKGSILSENLSITHISANERQSVTKIGLFENLEEMLLTDVNIYDQKSEIHDTDVHENLNQKTETLGMPDKVTNNVTRNNSEETLLSINENGVKLLNSINTEEESEKSINQLSNLDSRNDTVKQQPDLLDEYNELSQKPSKLVSQSVILDKDTQTLDINKEFPEKIQNTQQYQMSTDRLISNNVSRQSNMENNISPIGTDGEHPQNNLDRANVETLNKEGKGEDQLDNHEPTLKQTSYVLSNEIEPEFVTQYKDIDDATKSSFVSEQFPSSNISGALNKTAQPTSILQKDYIEIETVVTPTFGSGQFFPNETLGVFFQPPEPITTLQNGSVNIDLTSNSNFEINKFPSNGPSEVLYKPPQTTAILQKDVGPWKIDLALQSYTDENNERVIKSFNSDNAPRRYQNDALLLAQCFLGGEFNEIKIPIDQQNNLCVQIINNKSQTRSEIDLNENYIKTHAQNEVQRITEVINDSSEPATENIDYEDVHKHNKIISGEVRDALTTIYEQELLPLQQMIKGLREEIDMLAANQMKFKEKVNNLAPKRSKPLRLVHVNKKCACRRL